MRTVLSAARQDNSSSTRYFAKRQSSYIGKPRRELQILDTRMGFPRPSLNVVLDSISLRSEKLYSFERQARHVTREKSLVLDFSIAAIFINISNSFSNITNSFINITNSISNITNRGISNITK